MKKLLLFLFIFLSTTSQTFSLIIRDSEIEIFIRKITLPIAKAANQSTKNLKIIILGDNAVNAFVTPDQKIFIFTSINCQG